MHTSLHAHRIGFVLLLMSQARCAAMHGPQANYQAAPAVLSQGGLVQIKDASGYLSYQTPTPGDLPHYRYYKRTRGEVCRNDLRLPSKLEGSHANAALSGSQTLDIMWGNAAVAQAVADAMAQAPVGAVLYDLTLDLHKMAVLGLFFRRQCLVVSGSLALPWSADGVGGVRTTGPEAPQKRVQDAPPPTGLKAPTPVPPAHGPILDGVPLTPIKAVSEPKSAHKSLAPPRKHGRKSGHRARGTHRSKKSQHRRVSRHQTSH